MENFDWIISRTLQYGVIASFILFLIGLFFPLFATLGVFALIALPIVRVALSIILFAREKNILYICITAIVFINLLIALLGRGK